MRNWWVVILGISVALPYSWALADNNSNAPSAAALMMICTPLIQKGNANPPEPVDNLQTLQLCQSNCDTLFPASLDHGEAMLRSANTCKKSLNNLYFSSVAKTNIDQLDQQLSKRSTDLSVFEKLNSIIHQQSSSNSADYNKADTPAAPENSAPSSSSSNTTSNNNTQAPVSYDNINW